MPTLWPHGNHASPQRIDTTEIAPNEAAVGGVSCYDGRVLRVGL